MGLTEGRRPHGVVLPHIVMHHLEVPGPLTSAGVEGDETVREQVLTRAVATVVGRGRGGQGNVDEAELLVSRNAAPRPEIP